MSFVKDSLMNLLLLSNMQETLNLKIGLIMLILPNTGTNAHFRLKEGFVIVALGWLTMSVCGALPFFFSGALPTFVDSFFE